MIIVLLWNESKHVKGNKTERRNLRPLTASDRVDNSQNVGKLFIYKGETR